MLKNIHSFIHSLNFNSLSIFIPRNFIESVEYIVLPFIFIGVPIKRFVLLFADINSWKFLGFTIISFRLSQSTAVFDSFSRTRIRSSKLDASC